MTVLSISRQFGAGGWTLGKAIAERLNYQFVSVGVIEQMAKKARVSPEWIKSTEKSAGDWLLRFTSKLVSSSFIERHVGESRADFDEDKYLIFLDNIKLIHLPRKKSTHVTIPYRKSRMSPCNWTISMSWMREEFWNLIFYFL